MNYLNDIKPLEDSGKTDAQIAAILSTVRRKPVPLADLEANLTLWGILGRDPVTNNRSGSLVTAATNASQIQPVAQQLLSWLGSARSQQISTDTAEVAPVWAAGIAGMVAATILTQAQADVLNGLAGDLRHGTVTEQQVSDARTAHEAAVAAEEAAEVIAQQRNSYRARFDSVLNQIGTVEQSQAVTALRTIADELEA